jgi:DNA-binding MarR family transcriptional regulator
MVIGALTEEQCDGGLSSKEFAIFSALLARHHAGLPSVGVTEALRWRSFGSPVTLHKAIDGLVRTGLVTHVTPKKDARQKKLIITSKGHRFIDSLDKEIKDIVSETSD